MLAGKDPYKRDFKTGPEDRAAKATFREQKEKQMAAEEIQELTRKLNEAIGLINTQTQRLQAQSDLLNAQTQRINDLETQQPPPPSEHTPSGAIKPSFFRGGFHPTFTEWLETYEEISTCNNWKEEQKLNNLAYYLRDGAKTAS